jgi:curved DNA-binding protein CbpA
MRNPLIDDILGSTNAFEILGLPSSCTDPDEVYRAFQERQRAVHPDRTRDPRALEAMQRLGVAYNKISQKLAPRTQRSVEPDQSPSSMFGGLLRLVGTAFFIFLVAKYVFHFEFSSEGFGSDDISRDKLKGFLTFEMPHGQHYMEMNPAKFRKKFYVPRWWAEENVMRFQSRGSLMAKLNEVADVLWKEQLEIDCELEHNRMGKGGKQCQALKTAGFERRE